MSRFRTHVCVSRDNKSNSSEIPLVLGKKVKILDPLHMSDVTQIIELQQMEEAAAVACTGAQLIICSIPRSNIC